MILLWNSEENTFVIFPLKKAAITVPIPTDGNSGSSTKEAIVEHTVNKTSRQTLTAPKLTFFFSAILLTSPSIGITANPELIVKPTPIDNTAQAMIDNKTFAASPCGVIKNKP